MLQTKPIKVNDFIAAIKSVSDENLNIYENEIKTCLKHLQTSNTKMQELLDEASSKIKSDEQGQGDGNEISDDLHQDLRDDIKLYGESIRENEVVILNNQERLDALANEKEYRGLLNKSPSLKIDHPSTEAEVVVSDLKSDDASNDQSTYVYL